MRDSMSPIEASVKASPAMMARELRLNGIFGMAKTPAVRSDLSWGGGILDSAIS